MSKILLDRRREVERRILTGLASCDTLTMMQVAMYVYHDTGASAVAGTQSKLRKMIRNRTIGRTRSGDGLYRYYLQTRGCREAAPYLNFEPTAGHDRSYLNCSRRDIIINRLIRDAIEAEKAGNSSVILGRGALRRIQQGKFSDVDAILGVIRDGQTKVEKVYIKIDAPTETQMQRYENANKRALLFNAKLNVIATEFALKKLRLNI